MGGSTSGRVLIAFGAKVNSLIAHGEYWRLFTPMFLHVGLVHLLFNTFALLSFGRMAEGIYGHARFLAIYLVSGVSGALFSYLMSPNPSAGASGAIFGVAGALAVFFAVNRRASPITGQGQLSGILLLLVVNGVWGVLQPVIDNWGHLGGLVAGVILGLALTPRLTLLWSPEGELVGFRRQESPPVRWLIVPLLLLLIAAAVRFIQGR
jgi:rhomboid protease GluP